MKTGLAPLVACAALSLSSASAGGYTVGVSEPSTDLTDTADSYLNTADVNQDDSYNFQNLATNTDIPESTVTLGDSVAAATEIQSTEVTEPTEPVTLAPELKRKAGIENGAIPTPSSSTLEQNIKEGITGSTDGSGGSNTPDAPTEAQEKDDPKTTKSGGTEWTPAPESVPQATEVSVPPSGGDPSTASKSIAPPASGAATSEDQSDDDEQSTATPTTGFSQTDNQGTQPPDPSNNQWTQPPNQSDNQQPTQAPNNEAPQPTQAPNSEAPQPTQPSQPPQPGQNQYWQDGWQAGSQNYWQGSWGSATQTQPQSPTTTFDSNQESNRDSPVPTEPPATAPPPPVSKCTVRRSRD